MGCVAEQVGSGVQAYVREIGGWRLPDASDEPRSERRPGEAACSGQLLDCPVVAGSRWIALKARPICGSSAQRGVLEHATGGVVIAFAQILDDA